MVIAGLARWNNVLSGSLTAVLPPPFHPLPSSQLELSTVQHVSCHCPDSKSYRAELFLQDTGRLCDAVCPAAPACTPPAAHGNHVQTPQCAMLLLAPALLRKLPLCPLTPAPTSPFTSFTCHCLITPAYLVDLLTRCPRGHYKETDMGIWVT